jgi:hypothetical protein
MKRALWAVTAVLLAAVPRTAFAANDLSAAEARAPKVDLSEVRERAQKMPVDRRNDIDKRIAVTLERVNAEAAAKGQPTMAARLASEFGTTSEAVLAEKSEHGWSWGEVMIAHTLLAHSGTAVTILDLVALRREGLSWGAIAFGLQFHLEDLEEIIKAEGRVAMGLAKPDRKAAATGK